MTGPADFCDVRECADLEVVEACQDSNTPCGLLARCECDYEITNDWSYTEWGTDVRLAGMVDLWQFEYGCSFGGANAVGCGPVSSATVLYWWAQQGYRDLVDNHLFGTGTGPENRQQDWESLVQQLRDDYLDGGLCMPFSDGWLFGYSPFSGGQYAVFQDKLASGLEAYIDDAGYRGEVGHFKVCDDCNTNASNELTASAGLTLIQSELRAGRPLIMGFNAGQYDDVSVPATLTSGEYLSEVYVGELSNGTPVTGIINHYAVITGYMRTQEGLDVLSLNLGWGADHTDTYVLWNPAGKWLHLYTVDIESDPDGDPWCVTDRGLANTFVDAGDLSISHDYAVPDIPLAGQYCGIVREGEQVVQSHSYRPGYACQTRVYTLDLEWLQEAAQDPRAPSGSGPAVFEVQGI